MAYCMIGENPNGGPEQFEQLQAYLRASGPFPPDGQRLLIAGLAQDGWRSISVWDSLEAAKQFQIERLVPACDATGCSLDSARRTMFEVHTLVVGDLVGMPQPA